MGSHLYAGWGSGSFIFVVLALMLVRMIVGRSRRGAGVNRQAYFGARPPGYGQPAAPAPPPGSTPSSGIAPGWLPDPSGRYDLRYWSGSAWTEHVTKGGVPSTDPPPDQNAPAAS